MKCVLTEKKNTKSCREPIQAIVEGGRCCSWWSAYHVWNVPNALSCPNEQNKAREAPKTVSHPLKSPSVSSTAESAGGSGVLGVPTSVGAFHDIRSLRTSGSDICVEGAGEHASQERGGTRRAQLGNKSRERPYIPGQPPWTGSRHLPTVTATRLAEISYYSTAPAGRMWTGRS